MKKVAILKNKEAEEYLKILSQKYELPIYVIRNIVVSQFIMLSDLIRNNTIEDNKNLRFPNLGIFYYNKKRAIKYLQEYGTKETNPKFNKNKAWKD